MGDTAWLDSSKNRIYIRFEGFMDVVRAQELHDDYRNAIAQAKPGYTVLTYAEGYKPGGQEVQDIVAGMVRMAEESGCSKVARVIGRSPLGAMQINRLARSSTTYESQHFKTEREAEEYLDAE
jgi:hypothetical protein